MCIHIVIVAIISETFVDPLNVSHASSERPPEQNTVVDSKIMLNLWYRRPMNGAKQVIENTTANWRTVPARIISVTGKVYRDWYLPDVVDGDGNGWQVDIPRVAQNSFYSGVGDLIWCQNR